MADIKATVEPVVDIWPYVDGIDLAELRIEKVNDVAHVYLDSRERLEHICIGTSRFNAMLVIIIDRLQRGILGHYLLDLNEEYGVSGQHLRSLP